MTDNRVFLDITTLLRVTGHADGISRTLWNFARYALDHLPHIEFVFHSPEPWLLDKVWVRRHLAGTHRIDITGFPDPGAKSRFREKFPPALRRVAMWLQRPRREALLAAERAILRETRFAPFARALKPRLIHGKYGRLLAAPDGTVGHLVPHEFAMRAIAPLGGRDVLIFAGSEWIGIRKTLALSAGRPFLAALCYDTIPLLFPQYFSATFVAAFRQCVEDVYAKADLAIFSAHQIRRDTERLSGHALQRTAVIKLGADTAPMSTEAAPLPPGLTPGRFALFVSTIEPRKGHRTLFEVWKTLLGEGIPQRADFKLAFVGREGWMVDDLLADMRAHPSFGASLLLLDNVDDPTLATLYDSCAFTLYPSHYEGFGLPIVESFRHGKAVIASGAGALRETVDGFSPCLDPANPDEWLAMLRSWIVEPDSYRGHERNIRENFRAQTWSAAAANFFAIVAGELQGRLADAAPRPQGHLDARADPDG